MVGNCKGSGGTRIPVVGDGMLQGLRTQFPSQVSSLLRVRIDSPRCFEEFAAVPALLGFCQNFLSTIGTAFRCLLPDTRTQRSLALGRADTHLFQFRFSIGHALLWDCLRAIWANTCVRTDAARAFWARNSVSEGQCKPYRTKQNSETEPQATVGAPVAGNDSGTDTEQEPANHYKFHLVLSIATDSADGACCGGQPGKSGESLRLDAQTASVDYQVYLGCPTGLEPVTSGTTIRRSTN